jgi:hypothetical protein
MEAPVVI